MAGTAAHPTKLGRLCVTVLREGELDFVENGGEGLGGAALLERFYFAQPSERPGCMLAKHFVFTVEMWQHMGNQFASSGIAGSNKAVAQKTPVLCAKHIRACKQFFKLRRG